VILKLQALELGAKSLTPSLGILKIGTPICVPERDFIVLGKVIGIQVRVARRQSR
jgi:hypothetical protein